jgi:acyl-CoA thioesterase FadM
MENSYGPYKIRISDINYGGHMGNDRALTLFHDARIEFLEMLSLSEKDVGEGKGIIMTSASIDFKREVFLGDKLMARINFGEIRSRSFELLYVFQRDSDNKEVFSGKTVFVCFDYEARRPVGLPQSFIELTLK